MSCSTTNQNQSNCIGNILEIINKLQNCSDDCDMMNKGCDKPFLGPSPSFICFNTRPIRLYRCCDGGLWTFPYTYNGTTGTSDIFRVENVDNACATLRLLIPNPDTTDTANPYVATDSFVTVNLECVGALTCLPDTFIANL